MFEATSCGFTGKFNCDLLFICILVVLEGAIAVGRELGEQELDKLQL